MAPIRSLLLLLAITPAAAQLGDPIYDPIEPLIEESWLSAKLVEFDRLPSDDGSSARINIMRTLPDGSGRLAVNTQQGRIYLYDEEGNRTEFVDVRDYLPNFRRSGGQQGLSSFAFHPQYDRNGRFYTVSSADLSGTADFLSKRPIINADGFEVGPDHDDVLIEWEDEDPSDNVFEGTWREVLRIEQPFQDHNVGEIAFNPLSERGDDDFGMLYIAIADGGSDGFPVRDTDPLDNGQDLGTVLGAILRIDPQGSNGVNGEYGYPIDNPFADDGDVDTLGEIWAYGVRNPHRFNWDWRGTGRMYFYEIGQWFIEEINVLVKGANYGWGDREGTWVIDDRDEFVLYPLPEDDHERGFTYPAAQYDHNGGTGAIAGGFVYRGKAIPEMYGKMIFADFANDDSRFFWTYEAELVSGVPARIRELRLFNESNEPTTFLEMLFRSRSDARFGEDADGELLVSSKQNGRIYRIVRAPDAPSYRLDALALHFPPEGGTGFVNVFADVLEADWSATTDEEAEVLALDATSGPLSEPVFFTVGAGSGSKRLMVAGIEVTVTQGAEDPRPMVVQAFPGSTEVNAEIRSSAWLGDFRADNYPWIEATGLGWLYTVPVGERQYWFWSFSLGWVYTAPKTFPWIYHLEQGWLYVLPGSSVPQWYYRASDGLWLNEEQL